MHGQVGMNAQPLVGSETGVGHLAQNYQAKVHNRWSALLQPSRSGLIALTKN